MTFTPLGIVTAILTGVMTPMTVWAIQNTFKTLKRANTLATKFNSYKEDTEKQITEAVSKIDSVKSDLCKNIETIDTYTRRELEAIKSGSQKLDSRVQRVEDAIVDIRAAVQRSDEQFTSIMNELKLLSKLNANMETFEKAVNSFVPRPEVENRIKSLEDRIHVYELDRRK